MSIDFTVIPSNGFFFLTAEDVTGTTNLVNYAREIFSTTNIKVVSRCLRSDADIEESVDWLIKDYEKYRNIYNFFIDSHGKIVESRFILDVGNGVDGDILIEQLSRLNICYENTLSLHLNSCDGAILAQHVSYFENNTPFPWRRIVAPISTGLEDSLMAMYRNYFDCYASNLSNQKTTNYIDSLTLTSIENCFLYVEDQILRFFSFVDSFLHIEDNPSSLLARIRETSRKIQELGNNLQTGSTGQYKSVLRKQMYEMLHDAYLNKNFVNKHNNVGYLKRIGYCNFVERLNAAERDHRKLYARRSSMAVNIDEFVIKI